MIVQFYILIITLYYKPFLYVKTIKYHSASNIALYLLHHSIFPLLWNLIALNEFHMMSQNEKTLTHKLIEIL